MLTKEYISELIRQIPGFETTEMDIDRKVLAVSGYDAAMTLLEGGRSVDYPALILEEKNSGILVVEYGGIDSFTQSFWVMVQIDERGGFDKYKASVRAFSLLKEVLRLLLRDKQAGVPESYSLETSSLPYFVRNTALAAGYELMLTFNENINLTVNE